jgi:hypothetical protein
MHLHLVPRYPGTPRHLRGRGAFEAGSGEMLPEERIAAAARKLASGLVNGP